MTEVPSKWEKITPKRLEQVLDALRKLARTGAKDYEPIPAAHAEEMLTIVRNAVGELEVAYAPYVKTPPAAGEPAPTADEVAPEVEAPRPPAAPAASAPAPAMPTDTMQIAAFLNRVPKEHLTAWTVHLANRIVEEFHENFEKPKKGSER